MIVLNLHTTLHLQSCINFHFFIHLLHFTMSDIMVSRRPNRKLEMLGDINLGALISMSEYDKESRTCKEQLYSPILVHLPVAMEYMVSKVNSMKILPRNLTLGIVVLDDCYSVNQAMAQCLSFLPQNRCDDKTRSSTATKSYDVVGVIGSYTLAQTKFIAKTLSTAEIPVIGFKPRSDDLSDKEEFPYFFRTTTSERPLLEAFLRILQSENWTYISVVYERDDTGITRLNTFRQVVERSSCLATVESGTMQSDTKEIDRIVHALNKTSKARVVVLLTSRILAHKVIHAVNQLTDIPQGYFIWVDLMGWVQEIESMKDLGKQLWGTVLITDFCQTNKPYHDHFKNLTQKIKTTRVPWFEDFMTNYVSCSTTNTTCNNSLQGFMYYSQSGRVLDAVIMFAKAISRLLNSEKCKGMKNNNKTDRECITGPDLRKELLETNFSGHCEWLEIDQRGNRNTTYQLRQVLPSHKNGTFYNVSAIIRFSKAGKFLNLSKDISWQYHWLPTGKFSPESSCSMPCTKRQAKVIQENKCCWYCHDCRDNEYFINGGSQCEPCPKYTWPDPDTDYETCREIPPRVPVLTTRRSLSLLMIAALFSIGCMSIVIFFIRHKNSRIIKASSTMLSFIMLFAIVLGNVTIIMLRLHPNDVICRITFVFFCTSFSLLYGALLTRAFVIYRIFTQSLISARKPTLTSRADQLKICVGIVFIQILICTAVLILYDTWVKKTMPDISVEFVELSCSFSPIGLLLFLAYNVIMLVLCSYLAYKTRNLPNNFNETFYIAMCVMTTLLIWFVLSPSYTITTKKSTQMDIVSLAVTVNHFVAIVFLFLPKIYVIVFAQDHFKTRFYSKSSASGSAVTTSSIGSQEIMHSDKRKRRRSVVTANESLGGESEQFSTQKGDAASPDVIKVNEDLSESEVDLSEVAGTPNKRKQPEVSKEAEKPWYLINLIKPAERSVANESVIPNDPAISIAPKMTSAIKLQTALNEVNNPNKGQLWKKTSNKDLVNSFSDSNVTLENDNDSLSDVGNDASAGYSESGFDSKQE